MLCFFSIINIIERESILELGEKTMRTYYIYWMKEMVFNHYANQDDLFKFFKQTLCNDVSTINKTIEKKITKCIPARTIKNFFKSTMHSNTYYLYSPEHTTIYLDETTKAALYFENHRMILTAIGSREIELIWFDQLRKFAPTFFVYEMNGSTSGWISEPKEQKNNI